MKSQSGPIIAVGAVCNRDRSGLQSPPTILSTVARQVLAGTLGLILFCSLASTAAALSFDLVRDGQPAAVVVSAQPAEPVPAKRGRKSVANEEALAAKILVEWIKKISGAELPVVTTPSNGVPAIYVGKAAVAAGLKLDDIASLSHEGLRILADDKRVLIAGQSEAATFKAVARFLEELGCRYFMDNPLGEVYPRSRTVSVGRLAITAKPGLLMRNPKGPSWGGSALWRAWNGAGGEHISHQHSWGGYVPKSLFAEHPEFFAMGADGQRKQGEWLCTSNPELRRYFAERVCAAIERGTTHPSLSPTDGRGYCQCPACKAQDDPKLIEPSSGTVSVSGRYVDFFDDVARRVVVKHPESVLSFYCYADYTQAPALRGLGFQPKNAISNHGQAESDETRSSANARATLSPNLCAFIAPIRYCRLHEIGHAGCASREQQVAMLDGWAKLASRLGYYNYMYNLADGTLPMFKFTACKTEIPRLARQGLCAMTIEVLSNWHIYGPQIYLSTRLAYDPTADADALMEDYWQKFYGPKAAPLMKQYWLGLDTAMGRLATHAGGFFGLQQMYTPAFLDECRAVLAKAADAARGDEHYEQRVALATAGLQSAADYRQICEAMNRGDFAGAQKVFDELTARLHNMASRGLINREYATAYLDRFLSKAIKAGVEATAAPNKLLQVLPDRWRFAVDEQDTGLTNRFHTAEFDDAKWPTVATFSQTLDTQGYDKNAVLWYRIKFTVPAQHARLALFFAEVDGKTEVYVNGQPVTEAQAKARLPFTVDITAAARPGENVVAVRADHSKITDLALGGILRPVLLVEKPQ